MKLQLLDVFTKTAEDARVRTSSGGIVTLIAAGILSWLLVLQIRSLFTVSWDHALTIDSSRGEKMTISIDITFPNLPCDLLSVENIDEHDRVQQNVIDQLHKQDLDAAGQPLDSGVLHAQEARREEAIALRGEDYAGPCFGAEGGLRQLRGLGPNDPVKCMTCEDVHAAYTELNWAFDDGSGFEQCVAEGYPEALRANKDNGCRISGDMQVDKVLGFLHIAPGRAKFFSNAHSHDSSTYNMPEMPYDLSHTIHQLSFGGRPFAELTPTEDPLHEFAVHNDNKQFQFRYALKVVGTDYYYRNGTVLHTNQYSVTRHERPLRGGRDADHPHTAHQSGGIAGIWFKYDISPMKVVETETRKQSFGEFMMNVFAIVGAVITTAAVVDKGVYAVDQALKSRKDR